MATETRPCPSHAKLPSTRLAAPITSTPRSHTTPLAISSLSWRAPAPSTLQHQHRHSATITGAQARAHCPDAIDAPFITPDAYYKPATDEFEYAQRESNPQSDSAHAGIDTHEFAFCCRYSGLWTRPHGHECKGTITVSIKRLNILP